MARSKALLSALTGEILADYEGLVKYIFLSALVFEAKSVKNHGNDCQRL
ncbi:hypothetical protein QUB80_10730 [Chlorogloeopsis sp. ULAP01]|nr:hypothetical protein [Chlorogloeopsis sp. ULAP01]MDM9381178.1 hypothetical protein [Chlorogloeopsis sp. ULAP01]